ncbi:MAG: HAMP domain-containing protein [Planctomycetia bacterium]|nr:HAMP domain-containing protein [Planctomycetia bacterium]
MGLKSIRWRLQAWHAAILLAAIAGFGAVLHAAVRQSRINEIDLELAAAARVLEGSLRGVPRDVLEGRDIERRRPDRPAPDRRGAERSDVEHFRGDRPRIDRPPDGRSPGERPPNERREPDDRRAPPPRGDRQPQPDGRQRDTGLPPEPRDRQPEFGEFRPDAGPGRRGPPPPLEHIERALQLPVSLEERYAGIETRPYFIVWRRKGDVLKAHPASVEVPRPTWNDAHLEVLHDPQPRQRGRLREVYLVGPEATQIIVGRTIERELAALGILTWQLVLSGTVVFAVGLVGGWWLSGRAVRPIQAMSVTAASITAANLSRRIDAAGVDDELGELVTILNAMLDRIERAFEQQVRFTADASHELRTPLAIIMSHAELALARERTSAEYRAALEAALRSSRRMKLLVEELLTLARSDAGRLQLESTPVDLRRIVEESIALLAPLADEHQVRLVVRTSEARVTGDAHRLAQVVTNLVTNAILYNRAEGEVTIVTAIDGPDAVLTVTDTGVGISQEDLPHLFERFYRVDRARTRERGGSGLGLAICQGIVAAHKGTISVTSQLEVGTTFTVRLPAFM